MTLGELAARLGAELIGTPETEVRGVKGIADAGPEDITYLSDDRHMKDLEACRAAAVIVPRALPSVSLPQLVVRNPRFAFARALGVFHAKPYYPSGVSERAAVSPAAMIGSDPSVHPFAVVSAGARIGSRVTLYPGVFIGEGSSVGDDCILYPSVIVRDGVVIGNRVIIHSGTVLGSDGFGFVTDGGRHHKIPQVGGVIIGDDVEIGANCTVDRATLGSTVIGKGTKIDNMVHVAHNVTIGEHCLLAAQVGIAGSTAVGSYVVIGGQAGVGDHRTVGDKVMIGGGTAVTRDVEPGKVIAGHNAMPLRDWLKVQAVLPKLPELKKLIDQLGRRIAELEKKSS